MIITKKYLDSVRPLDWKKKKSDKYSYLLFRALEKRKKAGIDNLCRPIEIHQKLAWGIFPGSKCNH